MKSCLDCKHGEETMFDECRKCTNEKSVYYGKMVDERDLRRECEEVSMENIFDKIYELTYSTLTTPFNLIENALLDNYKYVKYYTNDDYFIAEMQCTIENTEKIFFYCFKNIYNLEKIYANSIDEEYCIFDRSVELEKTRKEYVGKKYISDEKSVYYGKFVDNRDLCRECKEVENE